MYMMHNELMALHEQRLKDLRLEYAEGVRQTAQWERRLGAFFQRIALWFEQMSRRAETVSERSANVGNDALTPVRVRNR